jgi:hypothetical protein
VVTGAGVSDSIEDPLDYAVRRLASYGFAGASVAETRAMVRARVGALADDLIARQPAFSERAIAAIAAPVVADAEFGYAPPLQAVHFVAGRGGLETGYSYGRWLRLATAIQFKLGPDDRGVATTPLVGIDWNLPIPYNAVQSHLFARAGFQLGSTGPDDVSYPCWSGFGGHAERCIVGQAGTALTFFDLLRLQGVWEESGAPFGRALDHLLVELGVQLGWPTH